MAWFSPILGGGGGGGGGAGIGSSTHPLMNTTSTALGQAGSITAISNQGYWAAAQAQSMTSSNQDKMYTVKNYAEAIGWDLTHHYLPVGMTSDDPKIAMLKLTNVGEVLKDVGVRTSDTDYYIMREPSV